MNKIENQEQLREKALEQEKNLQSSEEVLSVQNSVSEGTAEVLNGAEKVTEQKETVAEEGSSGTSSTQTKTSTQTAETDYIQQVDELVQSLDEPQLKKRITTHYNKEIKKLEKKVSILQFLPFSAKKMNDLVARIRELRERLRQIAIMALEALRDLYRRILLGTD